MSDSHVDLEETIWVLWVDGKIVPVSPATESNAVDAAAFFTSLDPGALKGRIVPIPVRLYVDYEECPHKWEARGFNPDHGMIYECPICGAVTP